MRKLISTSTEKLKLVNLPGDLVDRLQDAANKRGLSVSAWTTDSLEQALRADKIGASLEETIDSHELLMVQLASGAFQIPRQRFTKIIHELLKTDKDSALAEWKEAGRWYGEYLKTLFGESAHRFIEGVLKISWNLDEIKVEKEEMNVKIRFASFFLTEEITELLIAHVTGLMGALGYEKQEENFIRGLATMSFERVYHRYQRKKK